ncbi:MAG: beta-galactosidase [Clostridia bacterium]|nr:beta-galactosidase [Clostridia bacterium]
MSIPRSEHPFPQFMREAWCNLNGEWQFEIDHGVSGVERKLFEAESLPSKIVVPFCPESQLSGIGIKDFMRCVWYKRKISLPDDFKGKRVLLHIGACDYETTVWVNGKEAGRHIGGYISFSFDITPYLKDGENDITIRAYDDNRKGEQPAGKQSNRFESYGCMYTRTTGIWQTVWLEAVPEAHIVSAKYYTKTDGVVRLVVKTKNAYGKKLTATAFYDGAEEDQAEAVVRGENTELTLIIEDTKLWAPGEPNLYDLTLTLGDDAVQSYFGIREVSVHDHRFYINGKSVFGRFILDQGFYPDGVYTAPTDEALKRDIELSMACGYNGARLHQKIFEPRFLYHADRLGYMVWGEHANWVLDISRPEAWKGFVSEWLEEVERDFDHPALIGWCPFNETQQNQDPELLKYIYRMTKALDPTRPVIDTSGWFHVKGFCDMYDCHDYEQDPVKFKEKYDKLMKGEQIGDWTGPYPDDLCFVSEFGGTWWSPGVKGGWGYGASPADMDEFLQRYEGLVSALLQNDKLCAFCYTQLTDVEQEQNGLYTFDRRAKFPTETLKRITSAPAASENG